MLDQTPVVNRERSLAYLKHHYIPETMDDMLLDMLDGEPIHPVHFMLNWVM